MFQWRRFQFFDKELLQGDSPDAKDKGDLFANYTPTCSSSGRGRLIFGDAKGVVRMVNRDMEKQDFIAYDGNVIDLLQVLPACADSCPGIFFWLASHSSRRATC